MPNVRITLNTSLYKSPTQEDLDAAKKYILRRNEYATLLGNSVDECLLNTAQQIVTICYKYDVDPKKFFIGSDYNKKMMDEISQVMDEAEEEILSFIYDYSTESVQETATALGDSSSRKKELLAAWIATLGRKNRNLQDTLDGYLFKTMKDVEAAVAALRNAGIALADAVTKVKSNLHSIYTMPEVAAAFKESDDFNATYIRSRGVEQGAVGLSNSGATNVVNMAKITLQMAWMREQGIEFDESGAAGYYQLRGSSYPCDICDAEVGFHKGLEELYTKPYPHPHCCCYRIPIFALETEGVIEAEDESSQVQTPDNLPDVLFDVFNDQENGVSFKIAKDIDTSKNDYRDLLKIASEFAKKGEVVAVLKPYHVKSDEYRTVFGALQGTKYWGKNPDLLVGNRFYEYESYVRPYTNKKISRMLSHGMAQSDKIIIDNKDKQEDWYIQKLIDARLKVGATINEVWLLENTGLRILFQQ